VFSALAEAIRGAARGLTLRVLHDVVQQQRVLGESLHLGHQQVFELQPPAVRTRLALLNTRQGIKRRRRIDRKRVV